MAVHIEVLCTVLFFLSTLLSCHNYILFIFMHHNRAESRNGLYTEPSGEVQSVAEECTPYAFSIALPSTQKHCCSVNRTNRKQLLSSALAETCIFLVQTNTELHKCERALTSETLLYTVALSLTSLHQSSFHITPPPLTS